MNKPRTRTHARRWVGSDRNCARATSLPPTVFNEGLDETLTLHRLGIFTALGISLKTTNCLEALNAQLGQLPDKVDRWRRSDQIQRWVASAILTIEPRVRRRIGYRHLPMLQKALRTVIPSALVPATRIA